MDVFVTYNVANNTKEDDGIDIESVARKKVRDFIYQTKLMERIVKDIQDLLEVQEEEQFQADQIYLWDEKEKLVKHGVSYTEVT